MCFSKFSSLQYGWSKRSTKDVILSVDPSHPQINGLSTRFGLWIFVSIFVDFMSILGGQFKEFVKPFFYHVIDVLALVKLRDAIINSLCYVSFTMDTKNWRTC